MPAETKKLYGVNLLVSILTRFPEIDEAVYLGAEEKLGIGIDFFPEITEDFIPQFEAEFSAILKAYGRVEQGGPTQAQVEFRPVSGKWAQVFIWLNLIEVDLTFLFLLVNWLKEKLEKNNLLPAKEAPDPMSDDERNFQEEMLENVLQSLKNNPLSFSLHGLREKQQILVFEKNRNENKETKNKGI